VSQLAERLCFAYHRECARINEQRGLEPVKQPVFFELPDKGAAWFEVANAKDRVLEQPKSIEPFDYELVHPIEKWIDKAGDVVPEQIPTKLRIRPVVTGDLRVAPVLAAEDYNAAVVAQLLGIDFGMFMWRMHAADVQAASALIRHSAGLDAAEILEAVFLKAGGVPALDEDSTAWAAAAREMLVIEQEDFALVTCRTPGVSTLQVGPLRQGHLSLYDRTAAARGDWAGRIVALAKATNQPDSTIEHLRPEDSVLLWDAFSEQKKKLSVEGQLNFGQALSMRSTGGLPTTSTG
jgi:hypothetical protein